MESYKESEDTLNEELSCLKQFFKKAIVDPALDKLRSLFLEAKKIVVHIEMTLTIA